MTESRYPVIRRGKLVLRIKHKQMAKLLGISERYCRVLFFRRKIKLTNEYLEEILNLIKERLK